MNNNKPVIASWYFNPSDGKLELDCYLEPDGKNNNDIHMIYVRSVHQKTQVSLLHVPICAEREDLESFIKHDKTAFELLKKGKVSEGDILKTIDKRGPAVDFLKRLKE